MTKVELEYYETMIRTQREISESLKKIAQFMEANHELIWEMNQMMSHKMQGID